MEDSDNIFELIFQKTNNETEGEDDIFMDTIQKSRLTFSCPTRLFRLDGDKNRVLKMAEEFKEWKEINKFIYYILII